MADLAAACGVSESTVSRALRDDPRISTSTRARVHAKARELGYRPNAMVSALMSVRRRHGTGAEVDTVALVTDYRGKGRWQEKDVCRWEHDGVCRRAATLGYRIEEFALADYADDGRKLEQALHTRGIRGVLLGFSREHRGELGMDLDHFCIAGLSTYFHEIAVDRANFHGLYNVRLAFEEMQRRGHRRPGLVIPEFNNRISGHQWSSGALDWQRHQTTDHRCTPLVINEEDAETMFRDWFAREQPDSLIVYRYPVRTWLARLGLRVPQDVPVAYLYRSEEERRHCAGIDGNLELVGGAAFDLVVESLHTNRSGLPKFPKEVLIQGFWHEP